MYKKLVQEDGYCEIQLSLSSDMTPIMRCRAVRGSDQKYASLVRDFGSGQLLKQLPKKYDTQEDALLDAVDYAMSYMKMCITLPISQRKVNLVL